MKRAIDYEENLNKFLQQYSYQSSLTRRLDNIEEERFNQNLLNEIVLWKVNRYVSIGQDVFDELDDLKRLTNGQHDQSEKTLVNLLNIKGVDLPIASTILRFRNPNVFQIIDRHAYRAIYDKKYPLYTTSPIDRKISVYFDYLDRLIELCTKRNLEFQNIDRLLYIFDKKNNGKL